MKIKITSLIPGQKWQPGRIDEIEPGRGAELIALGHIEMPQTTPCRKNSDLYADSCIPTTPAKRAKKEAAPVADETDNTNE